jgi:hypothetical protein
MKQQDLKHFANGGQQMQHRACKDSAGLRFVLVEAADRTLQQLDLSPVFGPAFRIRAASFSSRA